MSPNKDLSHRSRHRTLEHWPSAHYNQNQASRYNYKNSQSSREIGHLEKSSKRILLQRQLVLLEWSSVSKKTGSASTSSPSSIARQRPRLHEDMTAYRQLNRERNTILHKDRKTLTGRHASFKRSPTKRTKEPHTRSFVSPQVNTIRLWYFSETPAARKFTTNLSASTREKTTWRNYLTTKIHNQITTCLLLLRIMLHPPPNRTEIVAEEITTSLLLLRPMLRPPPIGLKL